MNSNTRKLRRWGNEVLCLALVAVLATAGTAYAGEFPGLVPMIFTMMAAIALTMGALTELLLAVVGARSWRWQRALLYSVGWFAALFAFLLTRR